MPRFRMDNTEGYTQEQLDFLNEKYETVLADEEYPENWSESDRQSMQDHIAESILALYDNERFARQEERYGPNNFYRMT